MSDVRVSYLGDHVVIELLNNRAKNWYANNVEGAPAVSSNSVVMDAAPGRTICRRMTRDGLIVEEAAEA